MIVDLWEGALRGSVWREKKREQDKTRVETGEEVKKIERNWVASREGGVEGVSVRGK